MVSVGLDRMGTRLWVLELGQDPHILPPGPPPQGMSWRTAAQALRGTRCQALRVAWLHLELQMTSGSLDLLQTT